jgi:ankyrin repeat protein
VFVTKKSIKMANQLATYFITQCVNDSSTLIGIIKSGNIDVVRTLIAAGLNVHQHGGVALETAATAGDEPMVQILIEAGAIDTSGRSLYLAAKEGHIAVVKVLVGVATKETAESALRIAVTTDRTEVVQFLLERGVGVGRGEKMLNNAALNGNVTILSALLAVGASGVDQALDTAVYHKRPDAVRLLLAAGAKPGAAPDSTNPYWAAEGFPTSYKLFHWLMIKFFIEQFNTGSSQLLNGY